MKIKKAVFAGGCFWCMIPPFQNLRGVKSVIAGYTGGPEKNPTYEEVSSGKTGHYEAVQVSYQPEKISYEKLLEVFWKQINPEDIGGQFADRGKQYKTAIFYHNSSQKKLAEQSKEKFWATGKFSAIATEIKKSETFYPAEEYHQDYAKKNPIRYKFYKLASGRDMYLKSKWKK